MRYSLAQIKRRPAAGHLFPTVFVPLILLLLFPAQSHPEDQVRNQSIAMSAPSAYAIQAPLRSCATKEGIIGETNRARAATGLLPLVENDLLNRVAQDRVDDMLQHQYFGHISPAGNGYTDLALRLGYVYHKLCENIARMSPYSTDEKFLDLWMHSPTHRRNILDDEVREIGVAVRKIHFKGKETWVSVQIFGVK